MHSEPRELQYMPEESPNRRQQEKQDSVCSLACSVLGSSPGSDTSKGSHKDCLPSFVFDARKEPRAVCILGMRSTEELPPHQLLTFFICQTGVK